MSVLALLGLAEPAVVRIAARLGSATAVQIAAAPPSAATLDRLAKLGVLRVLHVWDSALASALHSSLEQELIYSAVLAALFRQLEATTLVVGDSSHAWLGPTLAEDLDLPHVTGVLDAVPAGSDSAETDDVLVQRLCLQGVQQLRGPRRCVLAVLPFGPLPQLALKTAPAGSGQRTSVPTVERWNLDMLSLHPEELPRSLLKLFQPERHSVFPSRSFDSVDALAERLRQDGLAPAESFLAVAETDDVQLADDLVIDGGD